MKNITMKRTFNAPINRVWDAFTSEDLLKRWWSPKGMESSRMSIEHDKFTYCFLADDGKEFCGRGRYTEMTPPIHISYMDTFTDDKGHPVPPSHFGLEGDEIVETLVDIRFAEHGYGTEMHIVMENPYDKKMEKDMRSGWSSMFDKLEKIL